MPRATGSVVPRRLPADQVTWIFWRRGRLVGTSCMALGWVNTNACRTPFFAAIPAAGGLATETNMPPGLRTFHERSCVSPPSSVRRCDRFPACPAPPRFRRTTHDRRYRRSVPAEPARGRVPAGKTPRRASAAGRSTTTRSNPPIGSVCGLRSDDGSIRGRHC